MVFIFLILGNSEKGEIKKGIIDEARKMGFLFHFGFRLFFNYAEGRQYRAYRIK